MSFSAGVAVRVMVVGSLLFCLDSCSRSDNAPPVATASFAASKTHVPLGSPVDLTYRFDVAPNAKIPGDYRVFVHFVDSDGKPMSWSDDHEPPVPTSQWKPGQTIGPYTRTVFVPVVPYVGEVTVRMGLYKPPSGARLPLAGSDPADRTSPNREYKVGTLQLLPSSEHLLIIDNTGWNQDEYDPNNASNSWKWTQKLATMSFRNPKKDVTFYLDYDARSDLFGDHPQMVTVYSGDQVVASFPASATTQTLRRIPMSASQLGDGEMAQIRIEVDKTFVPATLPNGGNDRRELGIRVYHTFVEPKGIGKMHHQPPAASQQPAGRALFRTAGLWVVALGLTCVLPSPARADIVHLTNGASLSVESWQLQGDTAILVLRGGGQMEAPQSAIAEVLPDEYPHHAPQLLPEPVARPAAALNVGGLSASAGVRAMVNEVAARYGVDLKLAQAVVRVESDYRTDAVSPKGAKGLMQLMPSVAEQYRVTDPFDPAQNLDAGLRHLRGLLDRFKNDVQSALAAYNAGLFAVAKYGGIPPYRETQDYVRRIMTLAK